MNRDSIRDGKATSVEAPDTSDAPEPCQSFGPAMRSASAPPRWGPVWKLVWHWRHEGARAAASKVVSKLARMFGLAGRRDRRAPADPPPAGGRGSPAVLHLEVGDRVRVKPWPEIAATLDSRGRHRGLVWMDNMTQYCGGEFRVLKVVRTLRLEETGEVRTLKNTVLLEGVTCGGEDFYGCDRTCFHFWREVWLEKLDDGDPV